MSLRRYQRIEQLIVVTVGIGLATLIACGDDGSSPKLADSFADAGASSGGTSGVGSSSGVFGDGGATSAARGVIVVHAAGFTAMRLCFENYPDIPPQPDRKVLPEANVVGVELGSVVRLGPMLEAPGEVYVIPQKKAMSTPGSSTDPTCRQFRDTNGIDFDYFRAGRIDRPVGVDRAEVIAITGCGPALYLNQLKIPQADCPNYDDNAESYGQMQARVLSLTTTNTTTEVAMPISLVNMAPMLSELTPAGKQLDVTFGELDAGPTARLALTVPTKAALYEENEPVTLPIDQRNNEAVFGATGFRIAYRDANGDVDAPDAGGFVVDQSLAAIQASSRPTANPTSYFVAPSNFAFFLLGDPRMQPTFVDGGANAGYDPRRAVHLLAVPVRDDSEVTPLGDAGAPVDAGNVGDAGDGGVK